ncbi:hypothetical protein ACLQ25_02245 [Micromonospora sp. DT44]|uniref:hypothetical protein n=1 Tax=Micromonospora sp. DT44 TaxID=3393439 RepID=UPI003CF719D5
MLEAEQARRIYGVAVDDRDVEAHEHSDQHEVFRSLPFPFSDGRFPDNLGAVVQRTVLDGAEPAREVIHTGDNSWIVGDAVNDPNQPGAVVVTCINHVIARNLSVAQLASLPIGQVAYRENPDQPWLIEPHSWLEE